MNRRMKYITYCLLRSNPWPVIGGIEGIGSQPIVIVAKGDLCAAVSTVWVPLDDNNLSQMVAYQKIVEYFHQHGSVVPMRYGSLFNSEEEVCQFLLKNSVRFSLLIEELDGCVEMGIRLQLLEKKAPVGINSGNGGPLTGNAAFTGPGVKYLATRKSIFDDQLWEISRKKEIIERCHRLFAECCVKFKSEDDASSFLKSHFSHPLVSLYFLIPKTAVDEFRATFHKTRWESSIKPHLSGPWPPYNFV